MCIIHPKLIMQHKIQYFSVKVDRYLFRSCMADSIPLLVLNATRYIKHVFPSSMLHIYIYTRIFKAHKYLSRARYALWRYVCLDVCCCWMEYPVCIASSQHCYIVLCLSEKTFATSLCLTITILSLIFYRLFYMA